MAAPAPVDEDREKRCAEVVRLLVQSSPEVSTARSCSIAWVVRGWDRVRWGEMGRGRVARVGEGQSG